VSDFSYHSICLALTRLKATDALTAFVQDVFVDGGVNIASLRPTDTRAVLQAMNGFRLDYDDAYQYVVAKSFGFRFVSFDKDFDRTDLARVTPADAVSP
jgi:predicted nucleic acid-binding protein